MGYGGYHPYPRRFGGGKPLLQIVHESLNSQLGTALDATNPATVVWVQNHAIARAIVFDGWGTNQRLANQWDPDRMTDMLPRWESIMKIPVAADATEPSRRRQVRLRWERFGKVPNYARLVDVLTTELGDVFVAVETIDPTIANVHVPDASYPWGTVAAGFPWYSTVAHVLFRTVKPTGWSEGQYWDALAKTASVIDPIVPADVTWDWYHAPTVGTPINVSGGPSAAGFYLDEPNLDRLVFDE